MSVKTVSVLCLASLISCHFGQAVAKPRSGQGLRNSRGAAYCHLPIETLKGRYSVYLNDQKDLALEQRWNDKQVVLFLLGNAKWPGCGKVLDVIESPARNSADEYFLFKCKVGDRKYSPFNGIVGFGSNRQGSKRFVQSSKAWQVDAKAGRIVPTAKRVECDTAAEEE